MWKLLIIIWWLGALGLAYYFMETNGSVIKKNDATLYENLKDDKDGKKKEEVKKELENKKKVLGEEKKKLDECEKKTGDDDDETNQKRIKELKELIENKEKEVQVAEAVGGNMWMPIWSISNIVWTLGIFFGVGIIGHFILKQIAKLSGDSKKE